MPDTLTQEGAELMLSDLGIAAAANPMASNSFLTALGLGLRILNTPVGFPEYPWTVTSNGRFSDISIDWDSYDVVRSANYYVNPITGIDTNAGTELLPFKTLDKAIQTSQAGGVPAKINIIPGGYRGGWGATNPTVDLSVVCPLGYAYITNGRVGYDFELRPGPVYRSLSHNAFMVVDFSNLTGDDNLPTPLTKLTTEAEVTATPNSFCVDAGNCFVRTFDSRAPDGRIVTIVDSAATAGRWSGTGSFYGKNLFFVGGGNTGGFIANTQNGTVVLDNCHSDFSGITHTRTVCRGISCTSGGEFLLRNCSVARSWNDGFNYHMHSSGSKARIVELNCKSRACGGEDGNSNGTTVHDGMTMIRLNGDHQGAQDRVIHDVSSGTKSWNIFTSAKGATAIGGTSWACGVPALDDSPEMWLENCEAGLFPNQFIVWGNSACRIHLKNTVINGPVTGIEKIKPF